MMHERRGSRRWRSDPGGEGAGLRTSARPGRRPASEVDRRSARRRRGGRCVRLTPGKQHSRECGSSGCGPDPGQSQLSTICSGGRRSRILTCRKDGWPRWQPVGRPRRLLPLRCGAGPRVPLHARALRALAHGAGPRAPVSHRPRPRGGPSPPEVHRGSRQALPCGRAEDPPPTRRRQEAGPNLEILLEDLRTLTKNEARVEGTEGTFDNYTRPTPLQEKAFEPLDISFRM